MVFSFFASFSLLIDLVKINYSNQVCPACGERGMFQWMAAFVSLLTLKLTLKDTVVCKYWASHRDVVHYVLSESEDEVEEEQEERQPSPEPVQENANSAYYDTHPVT